MWDPRGVARAVTYWLLPTLRVMWVCLRRCIRAVRVWRGWRDGGVGGVESGTLVDDSLHMEVCSQYLVMKRRGGEG